MNSFLKDLETDKFLHIENFNQYRDETKSNITIHYFRMTENKLKNGFTEIFE